MDSEIGQFESWLDPDDVDADLYRCRISEVSLDDETQTAVVVFTDGSGRWVDSKTRKMTEVPDIGEIRLGGRWSRLNRDEWASVGGYLNRWHDDEARLRIQVGPHSIVVFDPDKPFDVVAIPRIRP